MFPTEFPAVSSATALLTECSITRGSRPTVQSGDSSRVAAVPAHLPAMVSPRLTPVPVIEVPVARWRAGRSGLAGCSNRADAGRVPWPPCRSACPPQRGGLLAVPIRRWSEIPALRSRNRRLSKTAGGVVAGQGCVAEDRQVKLPASIKERQDGSSWAGHPVFSDLFSSCPQGAHELRRPDPAVGGKKRSPPACRGRRRETPFSRGGRLVGAERVPVPSTPFTVPEEYGARARTRSGLCT